MPAADELAKLEKEFLRNVQPAAGAIGSKESNIVETKKLRVELDAALQSVKKAELNRKSRERSLAITKIQEGIMWLGMDLKDLDAPNPYPNSYNPANAIVEPTADGLKL